MRVLLHIGAPKCGSDYLQRLCLQNRDRLARAGILYPHDGGPHPGNGLAALRGLPAHDPGAQGLILSHEDLFSQAGRAAPLARSVAEKGAKVTILCAIRPFSEFLFGDYSQNLKQYFETYLALREAFGGRGFEAFAVDRSRMLNAAGFLAGWRRALPGAEMRIVPHRALGDALADWVGELPLDRAVPPARTNRSLRMADCDRIAAMINDPQVPKRDVERAFRAAFEPRPGPDPGRTPERVRWIEALFANQNARLREAFGVDNRIPPAQASRPATCPSARDNKAAASSAESASA